MKYDVFISYSSQDQRIVEEIRGYLESRDIRCFVAYRDIPRGVVWARAIVDALDHSRMMVVVFSDNFNRSEQVDREIELASEDHKPILTFRLNDIKFEGAKKYYLKNLNWIDAFPNPEGAFGLLYDNICRLLEIENSVNSEQAGKQNTSTISPASNTTPSSTTTAYDISISVPDALSPSSDYSQRKDVKDEKPDSKKVVGGRINGHMYVDLGLPSGLKWAYTNLGASRREEYGDFFAWGETETKKIYTEGTSRTFGKNIQLLRSRGYIDSSGNLSLNHDVARQKWGGSWRMPTLGELKELLANTVSKYCSLNGVKGRILKSKINGVRIFIPASGLYSGDSLQFNGEWGNLWSSTIYTEDDLNAYHLSFNSENIGAIWSVRDLGFAIRPVSD